MYRLRPRLDTGGILFGAILLLVGGYYFLRNTLGFDLGELDGDKIWPLIVVVLGASILFRTVFNSNGTRPE